MVQYGLLQLSTGKEDLLQDLVKVFIGEQ